MARASSKTRCAPAVAGVSLGLDEPPQPRPQPQIVTVPGPAMAEPPPVAPMRREEAPKAVPEVRPAAVFTVSADGVAWMVRGDVPGSEPFLLQGEERQDLTLAPWVTAVTQALREVTYRHFHGPVEIRIADPRAVGFLRVTLLSRDAANRWISADAEKLPTPHRVYREYLLLYHQVRPAILWVWTPAA